jgi:hypothetical protein
MGSSRLLVSLIVVATLPLSGCALSGFSPFAYPHWWDFTKQRPKNSELVGSYHAFKKSGSPSGVTSIANITVQLNADGTAQIASIPIHDGFGEKKLCDLSASGKWLVDGSSRAWALEVVKLVDVKSAGNCPPNSNLPFFILGQREPYRIYLTIGDPDSDEGIEFRRK